MKKNRIIISANVIFTIANFRKELIKFLVQNEFEIICVASKDELSNNAVDILNNLGVKFVEISVSRKGINPIEDLAYLFNLIKIYKEYRPKAVLHFTIKPNIYGTIACKLLNIPSINTINGLGSGIIKDNLLSKVLKFLYKVSLKYSHKILFQNNDDKDFFIENKIISEKKIAIVPGSGVDTAYFDNSESNNKNLTFILIARLLKDKGIYEYIQAIKEIKKSSSNAVFLLAGQFDHNNPSAIKENEVKSWQEEKLIEYIGKTDDIKDFFKLSDVVVLPSYREGLSRVLIEAASASKPIITTNVAGCKDVVVENVNGYLCELKSISSLKECIEKMCDISQEERYAMGCNSKKISKNKFDKEIVNQIYLNEINIICSI
jgi:glycosyltransferase involved in cell wall biosynthesis